MAKNLKKLSPPALYEAGRTLHQAHEYERALEAFQLLATHMPRQPDVYYQQGRLLFRLGQSDAALKAYDKALELVPDNPEILNAMGNCYYALGEGVKAAHYYGRVLQHQPQHASVLHNLTQLKEFAFDDSGIATLRTAYEAATGEDKVQLGFALGRAIEERGDISEAFPYIKAANALKQQLLDYTPDADLAFIDAIIEVFDTEFFAARHGWGSDDKTPIFIVGMPRCGSTLVEQILASHPDVCGAGEVELMSPIALGLLAEQTGQAFPHAAAALDKKQVRPIAARYLGKLKNLAGSSARVTDKMLLNYLYIGLVHLLLPHARIVHVKRDAMDTCWSMYKHYFPRGSAFAYDQQHLGAIYKGYEKLMAHWQQVLPHAFMTLDYETLVAAPEDTTRALLDYCGLKWDDACLEFHTTQRVVTTASAMQVRQPIYKTAIKSWAGLENELQDLRIRLGKS